MEINFEECLKELSEIAEACTEIVHTKGFQYISQMENMFNKGNALFQLLVETTESKEELQEHLEMWNKALETGTYEACNNIDM